METGDRVWRMPLFKTFGSKLKNDAADLNNIALGAGGGSAIAALFLKVRTRDWFKFESLAKGRYSLAEYVVGH